MPMRYGLRSLMRIQMPNCRMFVSIQSVVTRNLPARNESSFVVRGALFVWFATTSAMRYHHDAVEVEAALLVPFGRDRPRFS